MQSRASLCRAFRDFASDASRVLHDRRAADSARQVTSAPPSAREALNDALILSPDFNLGRVEQWLNTRDEAYTTAFTAGLKVAGLRE